MASLRPDAQADRIVPPARLTAHLTLFSALAMAVLAVFALALSLAAGRLADRWGAELARSATVRITAPPEQMAAQTAAVMAVLETTRGVASARALSVTDQQALLAPWFGEGFDLSTLPVPQLVEIIETPDGFDAAGLRLRLTAEAPGAVLDDHARWRAPLERAAARLRLLGWVALLLITGAMAAMITLAARASLAANAQVISVLRLVGATDDYIAAAFVRRFTLRALMGAGIGTVVAMLAVWALPSAGQAAPILTGLGFQGWHWMLPLCVPVLAGGVAWLATRAAAARVLEGLS